MSHDDFMETMLKRVRDFNELQQQYRDLYREVSDEEIKQRFNLWDGEEPAVP